MAMVLRPILRNSLSEKPSNSSSNSRVTFNLPDEQNIIELLKNDTIPYSIKLNTITTKIKAKEDSILIKWISDLKDNILSLEHNERIIYALLNLDWYKKDDNFTSIYQDFVLNLVTTHPTFIKNVLLMIIKLFCTVLSDSDNAVTEVEEACYQKGHNLLENILKLVPLCESTLCMLLPEKFPYMTRSTKELLVYVRNLLHLCSYFPSKRMVILECIIEKIIHIDVHCSRDTIEEMELKQDDDENLVMDQDLSSETATKKEEIMAYPLAQTLDALLDLIFKYIQESCFSTDDKSLDYVATRKLYKELLTVFDKIILPTHGCCHVQYLLFYIISFKQEFSDGCLDYLWKKVQDPSIGPVYRQLASFYIGSLLARAKYIHISTVVILIQLLCNWIHSYIDNHTSQDLNVHGTFHSVCQTVFYVFAFRNQEIMDDEKGSKVARSLNFDRIVTCRLNPLRYCDRNIVQNFANIARNFQVAYVYPVIEKNNRNMLYSNQTNAEYIVGAMIQTFFPFDPYILKRSKHWIESLYRIYNHCHKDEETMDTIDEDDTTANDSLFTYGSSPGFKKSYLSRR